MSRANYHEDIDSQELAMWRGQVASAIRGKRGQKLLRDMRDALDAMTDKRLIAGDLVTSDGECCAIGSVAIARNLDVKNIDPEAPEEVAEAFDVAEQLVREIAYENDECAPSDPAKRWEWMRKWVERQIKP